MCGFSGFIDFIPNPDHLRADAILNRMGNALRLRGPDEETRYVDDHLSFVFRRLSIVDVAGGSQPIWNADESIFVSVNGEIYNHLELRKLLPAGQAFRTASDSEIVLHLYQQMGTRVFEQLNGMFSIVLWDKKQQRLVMARDRLGIKPLYYAWQDDRLIFASELKALLMHPDCPREIKWSDLDVIGVQQKQQVSSYVEGVEHFPAGHFAVWEPNKPLKLVKYWDIDQALAVAEQNPDDATTTQQKYNQLLADSVAKRLMSDVPVGMFLSGGIDSSLIASLVANQGQKVHCFTAVEKTTYQAGDVELAKQVTESLGLPFHPIYFDLQEMADRFELLELENMVALIESPRFDPEWLFKSELHRAAKALVPELKVMLLGQGADEFAGGYSTYLGSGWQHWDDYITHAVLPSIDQYVEQNLALPERFNGALNQPKLINHYASKYHLKMKMLTYQLQHFNLWHEDRTSSYHGIESRVPFLDHRLVELLASVPEQQQPALFWDKKIVRNCLADQIPEYPQSHPKVPFFVTDNVSSINQFAVAVCEKIYPDFVEKYQRGPHPVFIGDDLDELYAQLQSTHSAAGAAWQLLEKMSVSIFISLCQDTEAFLSACFFREKSPMTVIRDDQWPGLIESLQAPEQTPLEWTMDTIVTIPNGCRILNPLTEEIGDTELVLMKNQQQQLNINIPDAMDWVVMLLDEMGRHLDQPKSLGYWAERTQQSPQELVNVFDNLVQGGFLVRV